MGESYRVVYVTQSVRINDPQRGIVVDKHITFPSFQAAVQFARTVKSTDTDRVIGKPLVEEA